MVKHGGLSHQFDGEPSLQIRVADENLRSDRLAENVGLEMDVAGIHAGLMNSPPHRANILSPNYNAIGVGAGAQVAIDFMRPRISRIACRIIPSLRPTRSCKKRSQTTRMSRDLPCLARKPQAAIRQMACDMALIDALDTVTPKRHCRRASSVGLDGHRSRTTSRWRQDSRSHSR